MYIRNFQQGQPWIPGVISKVAGPVSYQVMLENGQLVRRHQDHVRKRVGISQPLTSPSSNVTTEPNDDQPTEVEPADTNVDTNADPTPFRRYPSRTRQPPTWYEQNLNTFI